MKLSRDAVLVTIIFAVLVLATIAAAFQEQTTEAGPPPLASTSNDPSGAAALMQWLDRLGYDAHNRVGRSFQIPAGASIVMLLEPTEFILQGDWDHIDSWVEDGGTLIMVGNGLGARAAIEHYDFTPLSAASSGAPLTVQTPLTVFPPIAGTIDARAEAVLRSTRNDFIELLSLPEGPVVVSLDVGQGRVIIGVAPFMFSNAGLKEPGNGEFVLNMVWAARNSGDIWFDEWHHGMRPGSAEDQQSGFTAWLARTPSGQSLLYAGLVIFAAMLLQGVRFGRPVSLLRDRARRAPLEYVTALANLGRRAGHRGWVLAQYHNRLKHGLGRRYRLSPTIDDTEFLTQLHKFDPSIDINALGTLLASLRKRNVSEAEMIQSAAEVSSWLERHDRHG
jgi:hypothetical protein